MEQALPVLERLVGKESSDYIRCVSDLSSVYKELGNLEKADELAHESDQISRKLGSQDNVKYAKSLYKLNNVEFLSNPSMVSLDGLEVLIYHGRGIDDMVMGSNDFSHERNDLVMKEFLRKRHLAPLYGERTPLASELEDHLVIDSVPDVLHTGHVHINTYANYKGIHCINSGTFQTQTEFQKIYNIVPTPAEVPIIDVGGNYKQLKFID